MMISYVLMSRLFLFLDGGASVEVTLTDYLSKISEQMAMKVSAVIQVVETGHVQAFQDDFRLRKPDLEVKVIVVVSWEYGIVEFRDYPDIREDLCKLE